MQKNNTNSEKLDAKVKESLQDLEVPYEPAHWAEMEQMLDAAPKSYVNFKGWSYGLNTLLAVAVLTGAFLAYDHFSTAAPEASVAQPAEQKVMPVQPAPFPAADLKKEASDNMAVSATAPSEAIAEQGVVTAPVAGSVSGSNYTTATYNAKRKQETARAAEGTNPEDAKSDIPADMFDFSKTGEMGRSLNKVPTFSDQIDLRNGFSKTTSENPTLVKEAQEKIAGGVPDSFVPTQLKKDSIDEAQGTAPNDDKKKKRRKKKDTD